MEITHKVMGYTVKINAHAQDEWTSYVASVVLPLRPDGHPEYQSGAGSTSYEAMLALSAVLSAVGRTIGTLEPDNPASKEHHKLSRACIDSYLEVEGRWADPWTDTDLSDDDAPTCFTRRQA